MSIQTTTATAAYEAAIYAATRTASAIHAAQVTDLRGEQWAAAIDGAREAAERLQDALGQIDAEHRSTAARA